MLSSLRADRLPPRLARAFHAGAVRSGFLKDLLGLDSTPSSEKPTEQSTFHMLENSPVEELRRRAAFIKARAKCPITNKNIAFSCPESGVPTHHDEEAWKMDTDYRTSGRCAQLRLANMFEHDLRSGREFPELEFPGPQEDDQVVNYLNWDTFFYTRNFYSMDTEFNLAISTKMLTYPLTIASILDQYSPYSMKPKGPLSLEGLKSAAALRYTLFPNDRSKEWQDRPMRFFILGARMESQLPSQVWQQLEFLLPNVKFELVFIGPEAYYDKRKQKYQSIVGRLSERQTARMTFTYYSDYFHVLHEARDFMPYDPYLDAFFLFHPGLGAPEAMDLWQKSMPGLLESKCPIYITGFHERDSMQDWDWLQRNFADEMDVLMDPTENRFSSSKWEFNDLDPQELYRLNQRLFAVRGKRYPIHYR